MHCVYVDTDTSIPLDSAAFRRIIEFYIFNCPARTHNPPSKKLPPGIRYDQDHYKFTDVSWRGKNFKERGLDGAKLNSLRAAMFRVCASGDLFYKYCTGENDEVELELLPESTRANSVSEFILKKSGYISQTEGIFYAIRNSFAHGSFEVCKVIPEGKKRAITMYKLENINKGKTKAIIRLREKTLLNWIDLVNMPIEEIKRAGK